MRRWLDRLTQVWGRREHPRSLALVRMGLALAILVDFLDFAASGLVPTLLDRTHGLGTAPTLDAVLPAGAAGAWLLWGLVVGGAVAFGLGIFTPVSGALLLVAYAQVEQTFPVGDRGIDRMLRNALIILLFSGCGRWLSVDALRRTGRWRGDGALVAAWPRHLLVFQLVVLYASAGFNKIGAAWHAQGDYQALFWVLQDPSVSRLEVDWSAAFGLTRLATRGTLLWEYAAPLVLLSFWYRHTSHRRGRIRSLFNRLRPMRLWVAVGVGFHLGIAGLLMLGIFPWGMLALYPAFIHPRCWPRVHEPPAPPGRTHPARALVLTGLALVIVLHALPWPRRLGAKEFGPEVEAQLGPWVPLARRLGVAEDTRTLWPVVVRWSHRLADVDDALQWPFRPLFRLAGLGQRWHLFVTPSPYHQRFVVEAWRGRRSEIVYRTRDPARRWAAETLEHRRLRPALKVRMERPGQYYDRITRAIGERYLETHPDADQVRMWVEPGQTTRPGAPAAPPKPPLFVRTVGR